MEEPVVHLQVRGLGVLGLRRGDAAEELRAFGPEVDAGGVHGERHPFHRLLAAEPVDEPLPGLHGQIQDPGHPGHVPGPGPGGVHHGPHRRGTEPLQEGEGDAARRHPQAHHPVVQEGDPLVPGLGPEGPKEAVGIQPAFPLQAQGSGGQVVGVEPGEALPQLLGLQQAHPGPQLHLKTMVLPEDLPTLRGGQEEVARFHEAQLRPLSVHGQQLRGLAEEIGRGLGDADVLRGGELLADASHGEGGGGPGVGGILLHHGDAQVPALLSGRQEVGRGATHHATSYDENVEGVGNHGHDGSGVDRCSGRGRRPGGTGLPA